MKIFACMATGVVLLIAGVALNMGSHPAFNPLSMPDLSGHPTSFSLDEYHLMKLGSWALLIAGGVVVAASLIAYWRAQAKQLPTESDTTMDSGPT